MKNLSSKKPAKAPKVKPLKSLIPKQAFSLGGHRSLTVLVVSLTLFISICVFFVNSVVLTSGTDEAYRSEAESKAELIKFNTALLKKAQEFSADSNRTDLPAGRVDPFTP